MKEKSLYKLISCSGSFTSKSITTCMPIAHFTECLRINLLIHSNTLCLIAHSMFVSAHGLFKYISYIWGVISEGAGRESRRGAGRDSGRNHANRGIDLLFQSWTPVISKLMTCYFKVRWLHGANSENRTVRNGFLVLLSWLFCLDSWL